ncbi:hypothetical protein LTR94_027987, partial [Friedmanniomyces endolithicus]
TSGGDAAGDVLSGFEKLIGSAYADRLIAATTGSTLVGGAGNDVLVAGAGADVIEGGLDNDAVDYAASTAGVVVNLATGVLSGGYAQGDHLTGIENAIGSAYADQLTGDGGANVLTGGAGDDVLAGLGGADTIDGGSGNNTADYGASGSAVYVDLASFAIATPAGSVTGAMARGGDEADRIIASLQSSAADLSNQLSFVETSLAIADALSLRADGVPPVDGEPGADTDALAELLPWIYRLYTMACEREIHAPFFLPGMAPATPAIAPVVTFDDDDDGLF